MSGWVERSLDELGTVERGRSRHRPRNDPSLYGTAMPFFQTGDVKAAVLHMRRPQQWYSDLGVAQSRVWRPGITCITIAANIADTAVLDSRGCFPDSVLGFTPSEQAEDAYFVKYLLDVHRERLGSAARGTTQDNLSLEKLLSFRFPVPDANDRRAIVSILRSIDDIIENNRRRVQVLEEMARSIYHEWFVKFRYPGHQEVSLVDSALGPIPEEWQVAPASTAMGINPRIKLDRSVEHPFIAMGDLDKGGMGCRPSQVRSGGSGAKFERGDTLFARITPCLQNGKTGLVQSLADGEVGLGSTEFIVLRGQLIGPAFTYCLARDDSFRGHAIASMSGASGRQRVRNECFDTYLLAVPPQKLADTFESTLEPLLSHSAVLLDEAGRLESLRDRLLPKLVTGQIEISALNLDEFLREKVA